MTENQYAAVRTLVDDLHEIADRVDIPTEAIKDLVKDIRHLAEASESPDPVLVEELVTSYEAAIADGEISPDELLGLYEDVNDVLESMQVSPELALQ